MKCTSKLFVQKHFVNYGKYVIKCQWNYYTQYIQSVRSSMMMTNEDKLECECTQIKRSGRRAGASKKRKILRWVSLISSLLCSSPRLPLACRGIKNITKRTIFLLRGKDGRHGREPSRICIIQRGFTNRWRVVCKKGLNLSHFQGPGEIFMSMAEKSQSHMCKQCKIRWHF